MNGLINMKCQGNGTDNKT